LKKSLYGDRVANLAWDETQSKWHTSKEIGFHRLQSEGSICIKWTEVEFIAILNAVDDQLYFATDASIKKWFEVATQSRFDVQLMGQATWYLQSRITQCTDFSIILDQSRYAALVLQRYINHVPDVEITQKMKDRYATPRQLNLRKKIAAPPTPMWSRFNKNLDLNMPPLLILSFT
jgi:Reverse transcriptase (RNA-dependent DNA polymerase)